MLVVTAVLTWLTPLGIFILFAALAPLPRQPPPQAGFWVAITLLGAIIASAMLVLSVCEFVRAFYPARRRFTMLAGIKHQRLPSWAAS